MKIKMTIVMLSLVTMTFLAACGEDLELKQFKKGMDAFCSKVTEIDQCINNIDAEKENAPKELLSYLNDLKIVFQSLERLDFPVEFDYLEGLAKEATEYMTVAVENYEAAFSNGTYSPETAAYAMQNYERANKRVQIILAFLRGEEPNNADVTIQYAE